MDIIFSTDRTFLQGHFYPVRKTLRGEVVVFDGSQTVVRETVATQSVATVPVALQPAATQVVVSREVPDVPEQRLKPELVPSVVEAATPEREILGEQSSYSAQAFAAAQTLKGRKQSAVLKSVRARLINFALSSVVVISLLAGSVLLVPSLYYAIFPPDVIEVTAPENGTAFGGAFDKNDQGEQVEAAPAEEPKYVPPQDMTLPDGDWLVIPRIGVRSVLQPTLDPEEALATGLWWVPDFGKAGETELPMIVAAHRYGWQWWWKTDYWKYHSFYKLPETQPGDRIEVISDHRKWIYEIYAGEEGEEINDYSADLILYTCKFLKSPVRHFRYARLIDPNKDTQTGVTSK